MYPYVIHAHVAVHVACPRWCILSEVPPGSAAGRFRPQRCSGIVSEVSVLVGTRPAKTRSRISSTVGPTCGAEVAAACAGRLSRGQPVVPGAEYQEAQQTPARALSRA